MDDPCTLREYLVHQPRKDEAFSGKLRPGAYLFEWVDPARGVIADRGRLETSGGRQPSKAPSEADAVLYLKKADGLS